MKCRALSAILLLVAMFSVHSAWGAPSADEQKAIDAIKRLGGKVEFDGDTPIAVDLADSQATHKDLHWLKNFPKLKSLEMWGAGITDAGLDHLRGLTNLQTLVLENTDITDKGLEKLVEVPSIKSLNLRRCSNLTDEGLAYVK